MSNRGIIRTSEIFTEKLLPDEQISDYLVEDEVRVYPASIVFADAYDGKYFEENLKIINCGRKSAFIRILRPSAEVIIAVDMIHNVLPINFFIVDI